MAPPVIEASGLTKHYGSTAALQDLDLRIEAGEVFGFLGPNGAGKTTTIRLLLDLIRPTRGGVRLFGRPPADPAIRARVGCLPGELQLDERLTGRQTLVLLDALLPRDRRAAVPRRDEICERLGLLPADLDRKVRDYSRGMKQKIGMVSALQHDPDLLLLDEPTTGLDPLVREEVFEILRDAGARGRTVFHSSHVLSEVDRTCSRVGVVRQGRLVALEGIDDLRRRSRRRLVVRFRGVVSGDELDLPGIEIVEHEDRRFVLRVSGDLNPLLRALARHEVESLVFPEADLEESFVSYYRGDAPPGT